ncbi:hypothetical protein BD770DRAFT_381285 [Pilaira anomala]|nr:hypothetical protein BD770DRAFT_381285 [Pilaira anomala]
MTTIRESSLFNWINLYYNISSLNEFKNIPTLVLFIQSLFNHHEFEIHDNDIPLLLNEINSIIPVCTILPQHTINVSGIMNGDQTEILSLLGIIQTQYQAYTIIHTILHNRELSFTAHIPQFIPNRLQDVRNIIFSWSNHILTDYVGASLILPLLDFTISSWQSGLYLLAILHYHNPSIVPELIQYEDLSIPLQLLSQHYHIPILFDTSLLQKEEEEEENDESTILTYLVELIPHLFKPTKDETIQRHRDIERFKNQSNKKTTFTSTYTLQQLKITKTTVLKYSDGTDIPTDLEEFESRASTLTDKLNTLQHRLMLIVPTRSSNYSASSVDSLELFLTDDNTTNSTCRNNENSSHASSSMMSGDESMQHHTNNIMNMMKVLHPLQAAEEDYAAYDKNFKSLQSEFQQLTDGDLYLLQTYLSQELKPVWREDPKVTSRIHQLFQLHQSLSNEFEKSEITLSHFRRGFAFSRMCGSISHELDIVQNKMVKSITTHGDIEELENHMLKTTDMVNTLETNFLDLVNDDTCYSNKFDQISSKNQLVKNWVQEVRVWFTEAERIKKWIEIRIDQLNSTPLPDPLTSIDLPASQSQVDQFNISHSLLEKEIELFDKEDMARLRSHVKTLTGSDRADKDLSPADTTTIEITLTTLTTLDKLIHSLRRKSYDLQVLTQRVLWEDEYKKAMLWLEETDNQVDQFIKSSARWTQAEEEEEEEEEHPMILEEHVKRERLMAKEKQKEIIVQQLLTLERKMAEFDQGQFTRTVDSFQDLDNTSSVELPHHLESRQDQCEQFFEDLMKRMTFARNVVEQRLNVMDFLYQTETVLDDAKSLQLDLMDAETKSHPGDNDREMTARVQNMHERIVQLVTATAGRIPYPVPGLPMDELPNTIANQEIQQVITCKRNDLILTSEDLDERLHSFRNVLQLHKRSKEYLDDASRLCDWADERVKIIRKSKINQQDATSITIQDLQRLERDRDNILNKLKNGKENDVVDLLTRIQLLLETGQKLNVSALDKEGLLEVSQQLEERFDRLQHILEEHGLDLQTLRKKMEDGNTYFETARSLRSFISETRHSMPGLKQTCGFMTGQSEAQDKRRFEMLNHSLNQINASYAHQQPKFAQLCSHFKLMDKAKIDNIQEINQTQSALESDWVSLGNEILDLASFSTTVGEWYHRQRRLSMVENDLLAGINDDIAHLAKSGWSELDLKRLQDKIDTALIHLTETGQGISTADNKDDPLQTANYSCARDRHTFLTQKAKSASENLLDLKNNANKAMAYSAFLCETDQVLNRIQSQKETIGRRMAKIGTTTQFASKPMDTIDTLYKTVLTTIQSSEKESLELAKALESLIGAAKTLESEGYDPFSVQEPILRIKNKLDQLASTIELERKQANFIRKIHTHAKAANDLSNWIDHCSEAMSELGTDVCMNEQQDLVNELDHVEQRIIEMRPTIQAFELMESRIFATKDGSQLDLCELSLDRNEIKQAVRDREATLLKSWTDLKSQYQTARQSLNTSIQGVEIARKVKSILTQVGDMKDRVSAVRICRNTHLDDGIENRDLKTVLSCPLTSIPTEHRLASAKAELSILDRDISTHLQPSIQELDAMLNVNRNEDIFSGQRTEITIAVRGLMDLMKAKRRAISEAEKMEGFLTVMEELEVLLLALTEVVSRADPNNARIVEDGNYSRTDLQALLIDLDTRYRYYEPKINDLLVESKQVAENLMSDRRVVDCIKQLTHKWEQLKAEAAAKKADLMARIGPLGDTFDALHASEGMLVEKGRLAASLVKKTSTPVLKQPPSPKMMQSTPRYMTGYNRTTRPSFNSTTHSPAVTAGSATAARANAKRTTTGGSISPTARRVAVRQMAAQQQRNRHVVVKTPENYVSDPKNDLDVALGDILNDSPYKIQVKMVPGEVGKYWFGNVNPKLAYCRILRSRMVMVRVGGGWVELSQFLRDHALLEGGNFVSGRAKLPTSSGSVTRDGFLNTTVGRNAPRMTIRGGGGGGGGENQVAPCLRESRSTPFHRGISPIPFGHGIKTGNKFLVTVDGEGNKVEVKMTKAKSKDGKFTTPRRINL